MTWDLWAPIVAGAGGALAYVLKKYVDSRIDRALVGQLEALRKIQGYRVDALIRVMGGLAEVSHCIYHLRRGDPDYSPRCRALCMKLREESRGAVAVLGEALVDEIKAATDCAMRYIDAKDEATLAASESLLEGAAGLARSRLREI